MLTAVVALSFALVGLAMPAEAAVTGRGRPFRPVVRAGLDAIVSEAADTGVPGIAVLVDQPGEGRYVATVGTRDGVRPVNPSTKFRIGSVTKTFTSTVILQLVDRGMLSLGDTLDAWQPGVQFADRITIRMLLNMTSGIFDEGGPGSLLVAEAAKDPTRVWQPQEIVNFAIQQGPVSEPGGPWDYSDTNYIILGMIAEAVTGTPINLLIEKMVLRPLHLSHTSYPTTLTMPSPAATGFLVELGEGHLPATVFDPSVYGAAGAMISSLTDLQVWAKALGTGALLSPRTHQEQLQFVDTTVVFPTFDPSDPPLALRYGVGLATAGGYLGHNGIVSGFTTDVWYSPATDTTIVVCLNAEVFNDTLQFEPVSDAIFASVAQLLSHR